MHINLGFDLAAGARMLQTRFVLASGKLPQKQLQMFVDDEHGLLWLPGGSCTELGYFSKLHSPRSSRTCVQTLCLPVGMLVFGLLNLFAIKGISVNSSSELTLIE